MASSSTSPNTITLRSKDALEFNVAEELSFQSNILHQLVEGIDRADEAIPLQNVSSKILEKVIVYCEKNAETGIREGILKKWDDEFMKSMDTDTLYGLLRAANYLDINGLLDLACQTSTDMIKGKTPEEIRKTFNIENDITAEVEEEIRRQNPWAFR